MSNISRFANSQNKVSELDLSPNNPYFIKIESLSRKKYVINPENRNQSYLWFFERANGQYKETLNKQTSAQQKKFKEQNPLNLKFVKSDVAKFINAWELEPHFISQGSQKNFIQYTKKINVFISKNKFPGDNFYKKLIANAIMFKQVDKLFGRKGIDAIGDTNLKAFTIAYTVSYFHFLTQNRIDLWKIYDTQEIDDKIIVQLRKLISFVFDHLQQEASGQLISEYAKRETSWKKLQETQYPEDLLVILSDFFVTEEERDLREKEKEKTDNPAEDYIFKVSGIYKMGLKFWDGFKLYIEQNNLQNQFAYTGAFDIWECIKKGKNLTAKDIQFGLKVLKFIDEKSEQMDEIKNLSKLEDTETVEIKDIYNRFLCFTKDEWERNFAIAEHKQIFTNIEFSNIKAVRTSLTKKEIVKEQALLHAYESLKKLKWFGISM